MREPSSDLNDELKTGELRLGLTRHVLQEHGNVPNFTIQLEALKIREHAARVQQIQKLDGCWICVKPQGHASVDSDSRRSTSRLSKMC
jgi:hypothetical protein